MAKSWRTVRVFISSTFRDMHAERDHLIKAVFPAVRERLEAHRIHLVDIDLRWGVTAEQADNDRVLELCLDEIKKSRPFFIGILGQRYGWVPKTVPEAAAKRHGWLSGLQGKSITELEILHGVLNDPKMRMHSLFYFREDGFLAQVPKELRDKAYQDEHADKLAAVKQAIRRHCASYGAPLREYSCSWDAKRPNPEDGSVGRIVGLEAFGTWVKDDLLAAMAREYPELLEEARAKARPGSEDWLLEEQDLHERFIESRLQVYVGRDKVHGELSSYLDGDSSRPLLLSGGSGTGKSSILGQLWRERRESGAEGLLLAHFVGASPTATDIRVTLRRLCLALKERFKVAQEVPEETNRLYSAFPEFLQAVPQDGRVTLIIDAVNQFDERGGGQDMTWLPETLPAGVKVVVSCLEEPGKEQPALAALRRRGVSELKVEPLTNEERFEIVAQVPSISAKSLDASQTALLLENPATANPLYLTVALEELRGFGSFEKLNEKIRSFPRQSGEEGLTELFLQVIKRLARELGENTVYWMLSALATSRGGLSERELAGFLARCRAGQEAPVDRSGEMLVALRQLRPYLLRRGALVDFYHRNLYKAVCRRYLFKDDVRAGFHRELAEYFESLGIASERALSETPHHLCQAGLWDKLDAVLTDLRFVEAKCAAGMTYELVEDYRAALDGLPEEQEERRKAREAQARIEKYARDLTLFAKGDIPSLEIIPSVRPWTDEEIEADCQRILDHPTRPDRIRAFSSFVASESHALAEFGSNPGFCVQQAYNRQDSGPVGRAAEALVDFEAGRAMILNAPSHRLRHDPHRALVSTLGGHTHYVESVSVTPDGRRAVSGSYDKTLRVWDLETGRCLRTIEGLTSLVNSVSVTADGRRAVSGSWDKTLQVWDLETGRCLCALKGHSASVESVSVTPDGRRAVSGSRDKTLRVWDLETGRCLRALEGHTRAISSASVTPDGRRAVSGSVDHTLRVWDLENGRCLRALEGHSRDVMGVSVTPDGSNAVSGSEDMTLRVWDLETGRCLRVLEVHMEQVNSVSVTPDGRRAVSGGVDTSLRVWDIETGRCLRTLEGHTHYVDSVSVTPDGRRAVSGSWDHTLRVWDLETGRCLRALEGHGGIPGVSVTPDGRRAVSRDMKQSLRVLDLETGRCLRALEGHTERVECVSVTPDGRRAVSGSKDKTLRVWDLEAGRCLRALEGHADMVTSVSITPDARRAVSGSRDSTLLVWDLETGRCLRALERHGWLVASVSVTPDGRRAVSGSYDKTLRVWELETGRCLRALEGHADMVTSVSVTPDGRRAVSGSRDNTLRVWDLETGRLAVCYAAEARPSISFGAAGACVAGDGKKVVFLKLRNILMGPPLVSPARIWLFSDDAGAGKWDDALKALCHWCGRRFPVAAQTLDLIRAINRNAGLTPGQSPCLELPAQAWEEPGLLSQCPHCHKPLKFNPFIVDGRE